MRILDTATLTPPEVAKRLRISASKVRHWIESGELSAMNVATSRTGRPRYRVSVESLAAFEVGRSVLPRTTKVTRRRRNGEVLEFF